MSQLYLVRHAQASFGTGNYDLLSDLGHCQARWLGEYFRDRDLSFDRVVCGSLVRHRETAEGILTAMEREPDGMEIDSAWNEFDFEAIIGAYLAQGAEGDHGDGQSVQGFSRILRGALLAWSEQRLEQPLPEKWEHFEGRVERALSMLSEKAAQDSKVLLISSGGPIAMVLRRVLDAPPSTMINMNLQLRNSSYSHLYFNARHMYLAGFNHAPHLESPERAASITYY